MISARVDQVEWTLYHLDDLDADFSRFYRREWWEHSGPRLFSRAVRLFAYGGALAALAQRLAAQDAPDPDEPPDVLDMLNDPAYAGMVEVG